MSAGLIAETFGNVKVFTIDRQERANALSRALRVELSDAMIEADEDHEVRAIVVTGAGERNFCSGADLLEIREMDSNGKDLRAPWRDARRSLFEIVAGSHTPTIAAINGNAVAGGLELALACDMRVASSQARVGMPEARRGMGANFAAVQLPRLLPHAIALELLMTGEIVEIGVLERWGMLNRVVEPAEVLPVALRLADVIARNAPLSVRRIKDLSVQGASLPMVAALRLDMGAEPYSSVDRKEGIAAFAEKRSPDWMGR